MALKSWTNVISGLYSLVAMCGCFEVKSEYGSLAQLVEASGLDPVQLGFESLGSHFAVLVGFRS